MRHRRSPAWLVRLFAGLGAVGSLTTPAHACEREAAIPSCIDWNQMWVPSDMGPWFSLSSAQPVGRGHIRSHAILDTANRPLVVVAPSPDPDGRELPIVSSAKTLWLGYSVGLSRDWDLGLQSAFIVHQEGAGATALNTSAASNSSAPGKLSSYAVKSPRLTLGYNVLNQLGKRGDNQLALKLRVALVPPLGGDRSYVSEPSVVVAPSLTIEHTLSRLTTAAEITVRIRDSIRVLNTELSTQLVAGAGLSIHLWRGLHTAAESFVIPSFGAITRSYREAVITSSHPVLEGLMSVRYDLASPRGLTLRLGGGAGLPFARERSVDSFGRTREYQGNAWGSPRWRGMLGASFRSNLFD